MISGSRVETRRFHALLSTGIQLVYRVHSVQTVPPRRGDERAQLAQAGRSLASRRVPPTARLHDRCGGVTLGPQPREPPPRRRLHNHGGLLTTAEAAAHAPPAREALHGSHRALGTQERTPRRRAPRRRRRRRHRPLRTQESPPRRRAPRAGLHLQHHRLQRRERAAPICSGTS
jgi:hypothetical protein